MTAQDLIGMLQLVPHPEGGWYREVYRSSELIPADALPLRYGAPRAFATSIYFLLEAGQFSAFHRLRSDELWFHLAGGDLDVHCLTPNGALETLRLGPGSLRWQAVVQQGTWFAALAANDAAFSLAACVVAPGFDFADFELADRAQLAAQFPHHASLIERLTRS
ncbi:MAG: cupin domain-containing protein [Kiritimatiellae bacterium]|nr:cupin domain-containing protein [Kiritimatiellia bacterium]MDW8457665.1 cupin domain-containing protein [Verrucomicrobiota bacterium]